MKAHRLVAWGIVLLAVAFLGTSASSAGKSRVEGPGALRIGVMATLFRDVPPPVVTTFTEPFRVLLADQTGMRGEVVTVRDAGELGRELAEGKVQLGVFHGIEYAWAQKEHPELRPLMIAINQRSDLRAVLVVHGGSPITDFAGLKGAALAMPRFSREHCYQFLQRNARLLGEEPTALVSRITRPDNAERALDDVVDGTVPAAVVEEDAFNAYQRRKPGRGARLQVAVRSEDFPAGPVAYCPGAIDPATLHRVREGLLRAPETPLGRQLLMLWKMTRFEPAPADYQRRLSDILQDYPPPEPARQ